MAQLLQYYKRSFQQQQQPHPQATNLHPTFEDLSIDDNLSELQRLVKYSSSAIGLQRLVHVKMLGHVASNVGFWEANASIFPLLDSISNDEEPAVRQHLLEQLALLAKGGEAGYTSVLSVILPLIAAALEDDKPEVRNAACTSLVSISKLMQPEDLGQHVLTIVLQLAHDDEREDRRMTAAELLNSLSESLGTDLCKQFVIPEVVSLAEDPVFRVRKATALNFENICKVGGEFELFERLMPAFVRLSKDDIYRVRRACADSIAEITKYVSDDIRVGVLSEIYLRLTQDPSKIVKQSALQQSGLFISSLPGKAVNESILGNYCSMAMSPTGDIAVDAELRRYCAYSFPAVLQTIGAARWPEVRELYRALVQSRSCSVKQTLACSLHEVARIISTIEELPGSSPEFSTDSPGGSEDPDCSGFFMGGVSLVERELIPVFEGMLQDEEPVQMGVMKHLAEFLGVLSVPCRVSYLPLLHDILHSTNLFNWRLRQHLAMQLPALLLLPPPDLVFNTLFTLVMTLLQDPVACVRCHSFQGVAKMVVILAAQAEHLSAELRSKDRLDAAEDMRENPSGDEYVHSPQLQLELADRNMQRKVQHQQRRHIALAAAHHVDIVANAIQTLIQGRSYRLRQLWVELSHELLRQLPQALFEKYFLDGLLYLTSDPVSNVRVAVAEVFAGWKYYNSPSAANTDSTKSTNSGNCDNTAAAVTGLTSEDPLTNLIAESSPWNWLLRRLDIAQCIMRLSVDHKDVYSVMIGLQPIFPHIQFRAVQCKGRKEAPGGKNPVPNMYAGTFSQAATCVASPVTLCDEEESGADSGSEEDGGESSDGESSREEGCPTWEPSSSSSPFKSCDMGSMIHADFAPSTDKRIGRIAEKSNRVVTNLFITVDSHPPSDRESITTRDTLAYRGSPLSNCLVSPEVSISSMSSPRRDPAMGFGVKSPSRKTVPSAVLQQQQAEEIMQERSIHLELRSSSSMSSDSSDSASQIDGLTLGQINLDEPMRAEQEMCLSLSPTSRRRLNAASNFERALSHNDSDDEVEDEAELVHHTQTGSVLSSALPQNILQNHENCLRNTDLNSCSAGIDNSKYSEPSSDSSTSVAAVSAPSSPRVPVPSCNHPPCTDTNTKKDTEIANAFS